MQPSRTPLSSILLVLACTLLVASAQVFFKLASTLLPLIFTNVPLLVGIVLYATGALLFLLALRYGEVSVLNPLFSASYIWVIIASAMVFGEPVTIFKVVGVITIITGIILISSSTASATNDVEEKA